MTFLLDTNAVSHYLRGPPGIVRQIQAHPPSTLAISAITAMELAYGVEKRGSPVLAAAVRDFLTGITVVAFAAEAAHRAGVIRAQLERLRMPLSLADSQIAGHALVLGHTLVTNDAAFSRVPGLVVVDWSKNS